MLPPDRIEDGDLARALPQGHHTPEWAPGWQKYTQRLVFPLYDHTGSLTSLKAHPRNNPKGYSVRGLVLADPLGVLMLRGEACGDGSSVADMVRSTGVLIVEGETDFLTAVTLHSDADEDAPAVIGIHSGAFTASIAARIPSDTPVTVASDSDRTGDRYAQQIARLLNDRCEVLRCAPKEVQYG